MAGEFVGLREWAEEASHPPSPLTWSREFVPALRDLLAENDTLRRLLGDLVSQQGAALDAYAARQVDAGAATRIDLWTVLVEEAKAALSDGQEGSDGR